MRNVFSSLHTHTLFCDGKDDVETMCRTAFEKGLVSIGFSAHAPADRTGLKSNWHIKERNLNQYIDEVNAARRRWQGKIAVYLGLEVDYIKGLRSALDSDIKGLGLDYTIGSVHYLIPPHGEPFTVDNAEEVVKGVAEGYGGDGSAMMNAYWDAVAEMTALGGFDIVGHMDLVKKQNRTGDLFNMNSNYFRRAEEIAGAVSSAGLTVEVNTGGLNRGYLDETFSSPAILRLLRRNNVPVLITADAHSADHLDGNYQTARQTLLDAGYTEHVLFQGKKNGKPVWRTEKL